MSAETPRPSPEPFDLALSEFVEPGRKIAKLVPLESLPPVIRIHFDNGLVRDVEMSSDRAKGILLAGEESTVRQLTACGYTYSQAKLVLEQAKQAAQMPPAPAVR